MYSVLLSIYRKEKTNHLIQALKSIAEQTLPPDEIILVEDYPRLKIISLPYNQGLGKALNEGLKHCSYDLVARMDTDDISKPDRFEKQIKVFQKYPEIDICSAWIEEFENTTENILSISAKRKKMVKAENGESKVEVVSSYEQSFNISTKGIDVENIQANLNNGVLIVILPKKDATKDEKRRYLTEEELPRFLALFEGYSSFNTIIKLLLYTGMRSGEALGLQWCDIDFNNNIITVNHTLSDVGGKHFLTTPKTKTSRRNIAISQTVASMLREHRKHQMELQMLIGADFSHPEMVFTSSRGNYKDRSSLNTSFRRFLKDTEFDFMTLHCLRHCNATLLLNCGVDIKIVSDHLGHSNIGTTANIYAHLEYSSKLSSADAMLSGLGLVSQ